MKGNTKIKIVFSIMIIACLAFVVAGQIVYANDYLFDLYQTIFVGKVNPNQYQDYFFKAPSERTIILRMDDVGAWHYDNWVFDITQEVTSRNMSIVLGIIPKDIEKDKDFVRKMHNLRDSSLIEFAMHGYAHTENEFQNYTDEEAYLNLVLGKESIMENLRVVPVTFIPPYNEYSNETLQALNKLNFKFVSSGLNEDVFNVNPALIGYNAKTYDFEKMEIIPAEKTIADCKQSLDETGVCVVMIHPQDYLKDKKDMATGNRDIDPVKYTEFLKLLEGLQGLNANFSTFKDLMEKTG